MNDLGKIEEFIAEIDAARDLEAVFASLRKHIERLGFEYFTYDLVWGGDTGHRPLFITSYPTDWINRHVEKRYARDDLVCRFSAQTVRPFTWTDVRQPRRLTASQKLVFDEASEAGLRSGCSVPIHGPGSVKAYLSIASRAGEAEFARLFAERRHELHLISTYAHERILSLGIQDAPAESVKLTPREIEIMTWTACGKTRWEISEVLGISEETVKAHIENACRKLNASNKTHATAIALVHGLIVL